jgi:hypothetical protein
MASTRRRSAAVKDGAADGEGLAVGDALGGVTLGGTAVDGAALGDPESSLAPGEATGDTDGAGDRSPGEPVGTAVGAGLDEHATTIRPIAAAATRR